MKPRHAMFLGFLVSGALILSAFMPGNTHGVQTPRADRQLAEKHFRDGNWKDAFDIYRQLCVDPNTDGGAVNQDLVNAIQCLNNLGRIAEFDALAEKTVQAHGDHWNLLVTAARQYLYVDKNGFIIAGKFERGPHRGGGKYVNALERDRVRALQLMVQAKSQAEKADDKPAVAAFYLTFAEILANHPHGQGFHFQYLTDLEQLPDFQEQYYGTWGSTPSAPVTEDGTPVFYKVPKSWEAAASDGERWRWLLEQAVEVAPANLNVVRWQLAEFLWSQFGVHTLQQNFWIRPQDDEPTDRGTYALHTLAETETIARLATGIKRFPLPDEFNYIRILQAIVDEPQTGYAEQAINRLGEIFQNRRQYPKAASYWKRSIEMFGPRNNKARLDQILDDWGRFEPVSVQPAGQGATVDFVFRNATQVSFEAHAIDITKLLADIKAYLKSDPRQLDGQKVQIDQIGWRLVHGNEKAYLGDRVATWSQKLEPRENHFDRRITITTPLRDPGAYLVTAKTGDGNVSKIVLWVDDTVIVHKQLDQGNFYYVADAMTGKPVAGANVEFFGFRVEPVRGARQHRILTANFAEKTDADGQLFPSNRDLSDQFQWLAIARTGEGRLAHFGFRGVWVANYHDMEYRQVKVFNITDRPVYRPGQKMQFKFWVRHAQYDNEGSDFAGKTFSVQLHDPKGEKLTEWSMNADAYGGFEGEWEIPANATLGVFRLNVDQYGVAGTFRVEEYKKPEFEVKVEAPTEPVMLGEKITAKIEAKYYFGSPVVNATVKYKILRNDFRETWYPLAPWDWCYGRGYWWFAYDYPWYPGWQRWVGCIRPNPWWWPQPHSPPEIVAEQEVPIGKDGTYSVEIDTSIVKELRGDLDHRYTIVAEVRDESRRTIVGQGDVIVAREPFKVFSWLDRGYYRVGDAVHAHFSAQTLAHKPVQGKGKLQLLKVTYQDNKPVETEVQNWQLDTNDEGRADLQFRASAPGQYRLSMKVTDAKGHTIEGGYLFTITGQGFDGRQFRFNDLELVPDKAEYQPGESVNLQINTDRVGSTVLLFVRPANGVYLRPKIMRLAGKSAVEQVVVAKKDMPNFFVEAVTITEGKVFSEAKEVVVPPEKRVLNVEVVPDQPTYKPGEKAKIKLRLTDFSGENFVGQTVVTMYDKALEYISGGSNVPDIKEFFWKWRRHHQPNQQTSLERSSYNMTRPNEPEMSPIGIFGATVADEPDLQNFGLRTDKAGAARMSLMRGGGMGNMAGLEAAPAGVAPGLGFAEGEKSADSFYALPADGAVSLGDGSSAPLVTPAVRSAFADTALWVGSLVTNNEGIAEVSLVMPENLTSWKIRVWGMGHGTRVGSGDAEVVTRKDLIVRLQAPRFFVQNDEVVLSANIHNYLATDKKVTAILELEGGVLRPFGEPSVQVIVPANGEKRVDWRVAVLDEGPATVRMKALTDEESDAMEMKLPSYVHGILKTESWAGTVRPEQNSASVAIRVPAERRAAQSVLEIRYSPTLAGAMVDALPYLADYPYGCTEQTLNRFLPAVITQKTLLEMNLNLDEIREKRTNLNAQELGDAAERARQWQRYVRNPVFDREELNRMVKDGVTALTNMQCADGGWGWFSGWGERSWPHTTAVVVHGLQIARQNDLAIVPGVLEKGIDWLKNYQANEIQKIQNAVTKKDPWKERADELDALVFMILVDAGHDNETMRGFLYRDRNSLAVYAKAVYGVALEKLGQGHREALDMILQNLSQYLVQDEENETAYLRLPDGDFWWYWYGSEIEANAYYLKLLAKVDPRGVTAPRLVKYLLNNRKHATYWNSTRDTALCVEAFADYLRASGEAQPKMVVEIWLDGKKRKEVEITGENLFSFDNRFVLVGDDVPAGEHMVEIRRRGEGPVYFNAYLTNFTLEDPITKAGLEVKVDRKYYRLVPQDKQVKVPGSRGQPVDQKVEKFRREPLEDLATVVSGDLVEVELEIESKNDYEYLIFEDMKAAGFEAVNVLSGYMPGGLHAYTEYRDNRVTFFIRSLARGRHSVSYQLRAEIPGKFSALPAQASAMYAPELKGNSDETKLQVADE